MQPKLNKSTMTPQEYIDYVRSLPYQLKCPECKGKGGRMLTATWQGCGWCRGGGLLDNQDLRAWNNHNRHEPAY